MSFDLRRLLFAILGLAMASCVLTTSFDQYGTGALPGQLFGAGGIVDGLGAAPLTLTLNNANAITVEKDGAFAFPKVLTDGSGYTIAFGSVPADRSCSIEKATGVIAGADATGIAVHCLSKDAVLAGLSLSIAPLSPAFEPATLGYTATALASSIFTTTTTVTATGTDPKQQITIAGVLTPSGVASGPIRIKGGPNPIDVTVTAPDGQKQTHYTIVTSGTPNPSDYLKASNTDANIDAYFGWATALYGDTLAVGAKWESSGATGINGDQTDLSAYGTGAVYVFTRSAGLWTQQAYIKASNTHVDSSCCLETSFGFALALFGDTLAVGSPGESSNATGVGGDQTDLSAGEAGAVYVFTRAGTTWSQQAYIKASNTRANARFGYSVALVADTLAVGSDLESSNAVGVGGNQNDTSAPSAGAAYVFARSGAIWSQQAYLKASNARSGALFGNAVSLSGNTLVVGSPRETSTATGINGNQNDMSGYNCGAAYVFTRNGMTWSQQAYVKASNATGSFGSSLAISGDTLAVGAGGEASNATGINGNQADASAPNAGAAYVFTRSGTSWSQQAYIKASNTHTLANFGGSPVGGPIGSIALAGDVLAVGAFGERGGSKGVNGDQTDMGLRGGGAVYVFARNGTMWSQLAYVKASNTSGDINFNIGQLFGGGVSLDGTTLAVGAIGDMSSAKGINGNQLDTACSNNSGFCGAVHVF